MTRDQADALRHDVRAFIEKNCIEACRVLSIDDVVSAFPTTDADIIRALVEEIMNPPRSAEGHRRHGEELARLLAAALRAARTTAAQD